MKPESQNTDAASERRDWSQIVADYNALTMGQQMTLPKVANITKFSESLARRGLRQRLDFKANNRGSVCIIRRLSDVPMDQ